MGLTIHYQLGATGDEPCARQLVQELRQAALDLPLQEVGEIVEFRRDDCDWNQRAKDDHYRWLLLRAKMNEGVALVTEYPCLLTVYKIPTLLCIP
ncbi:MAG: hypothetical protein IH623_09820 [Verrucomicrobia bacterium]|nr:hypothetical protein [Verrucomicrobiota bacterium]